MQDEKDEFAIQQLRRFKKIDSQDLVTKKNNFSFMKHIR